MYVTIADCAQNTRGVHPRMRSGWSRLWHQYRPYINKPDFEKNFIKKNFEKKFTVNLIPYYISIQLYRIININIMLFIVKHIWLY